MQEIMKQMKPTTTIIPKTSLQPKEMTMYSQIEREFSMALSTEPNNLFEQVLLPITSNEDNNQQNMPRIISEKGHNMQSGCYSLAK